MWESWKKEKNMNVKIEWKDEIKKMIGVKLNKWILVESIIVYEGYI